VKRWLQSLPLAVAGLLAFSSPRAEPPPGEGAQPPAETAPRRFWEINGVRLERDQVDRLADDMAERTVEAVVERVEGIALAPEQRAQMREIYRRVSVEVFDAMVPVVEREDLSDAAKEDAVRALVLDGQTRSHAALQSVLDADQMQRYSRWEKEQVDAYRSGSQRGPRRRRR